MKITTLEEIEEILKSRFKRDKITSLKELPAPSSFKDMTRSVEKICEVIEADQVITIVGDYDADGVCASTILSLFFDAIGARYELIIPDRFADGYGISPAIVKRAKGELIITVDNGISANEAVEIATNLGKTVIITDHHTCTENLPKAYSIVNPKQADCGFEFDDICGATVAWYLVAALRSRLNPSFEITSLLPLVAIATIADSMPLVGINRLLVQAGVAKLNSQNQPYIEALKLFLDTKEFVYDDIAFKIAPRINAAGRMANAILAVDFLKATDQTRALVAFDKLEKLNNERKEIEAEIVQIASDQVDESDSAVVVYGENWHEGVIGIVASRLAERFKKPAVVISINGEVAKGSARTIGDVDLYSLISGCEDHLLGFGGHKKAAGLSVEKGSIESFKTAFLQASSQVERSLFEARDELIGEIDLRLISTDLYSLIREYEPFGEGNPRPEFVSKSLFVTHAKTIGKESNHLKLILKDEASLEEKNAIKFFADTSIEEGSCATFYYSLLLNEFGGRRTVEMKISEFC